jgi:poly-gamma-glutamate synthesis protein (capsule biosynthesis protein)
MIAVGDVMTDRNVWGAIQSNGAQSIVAKVRPELGEADIRFANLECPIASVGPHDPNNCSFRADPRSIEVLKDAKLSIVSLANNHFLNAGHEAALQTMSLLSKNGIAYAGAQPDRTKGSDPTFLTVGGLRLGFLAYTDLSFEHGSYSKVDAKRDRFVAQVRAAKTRCDVLIVSFHWGEEYQQLPSVRQRKLGHLAIDSGADCVLGHHPHVLEGVESYHGHPILYSMGNFIFDQREGERMESAIFHLYFTEGSGWKIEATPIWIPRSRMGPIYPEKARADKILARLVRISLPLGTKLTVASSKATLKIDASAVSTAAKGQSALETEKPPAADRR